MFSEWCLVPTVWRLEALVCDAGRMIAGVDDAAAGKALALDQMEHAVVVLVGVNADVWALGSTPLEGRAEDDLTSEEYIKKALKSLFQPDLITIRKQ